MKQPATYQVEEGFSVQQVVDLLDAISAYREALDDGLAILQDWLMRSRAFAADYQRFQQLGGLTGQEFGEFYLKKFKGRPLRSRGHLRLIHRKKPSLPRPRL
jgi:hypothetical protein